MDIIQVLVLGIIQGLTEFLPVSSSGHLIFLPKLFGWADQGLAFDTVIHLGTLVAVVIYFRKKFWKILQSYWRFLDSPAPQYAGRGGNDKWKDGNDKWERSEVIGDNFRLGNLILLSIVPAAVVGFFWGDWLENSFRSTTVVGFNMIFWGVVLFLADRYSQKHKNTENTKTQKTLEQTSWKDSLFIGCAQALALIPGTSRSGITMTAGLFSKLDRTAAAEFSFLMSAPIIALAGADGLLKIIQQGAGNIDILALALGFLASALTGLLAVWGLMKIIQRWSYFPFVIYRIIVGILIMLILV